LRPKSAAMIFKAGVLLVSRILLHRKPRFQRITLPWLRLKRKPRRIFQLKQLRPRRRPQLPLHTRLHRLLRKRIRWRICSSSSSSSTITRHRYTLVGYLRKPTLLCHTRNSFITRMVLEA
jgi:hypothetical protein